MKTLFSHFSVLRILRSMIRSTAAELLLFILSMRVQRERSTVGKSTVLARRSQALPYGALAAITFDYPVAIAALNDSLACYLSLQMGNDT